MRLNEIEFTNAEPIDGYGPGFFRIGGHVYEGPVVAAYSGVSAWGGYDDISTLKALAGQVDVLFIGTGKEIAHIPQSLREALEDAGLGVEVMNSPSACRTYNILLSEGRRIAAALLPVTE
jgi:uncharacterized protein